MSVSLYYSAKRNAPLTSAENAQIFALTETFNQAFPYKDEEETLSFYQSPAPEYRLEGSTKLPTEDESRIIECVNYWLHALTQIRHALPDAEWDVSIDESTALWIGDRWEM
jgi:hypothetical protein